MTATRIIAVRHGETAWNVDTRIQGQLDIGLNDRGLWQAERVGEAWPTKRSTTSTAATCQRAHSHGAGHCAATQHALARAPLQVKLHAGLRERGFGTFEGQTWAAIAEQWPEESRRWKTARPALCAARRRNADSSCWRAFSAPSTKLPPSTWASTSCWWPTAA